MPNGSGGHPAMSSQAELNALAENMTVHIPARIKPRYGFPPERCDLCNKTLKKVVIDGRTRDGHWAWMCRACHAEHGVGTGCGNGQRYEYGFAKHGEEPVSDALNWWKVEG